MLANRIRRPVSGSTTLYTNPGGSGDRKYGIIGATGSWSGALTIPFDGTTDSGAFNAGTTGSCDGRYIRWDFGIAKLVDAIKAYQQTAYRGGNWKVQGSQNASAWTDLLTTTFGGSTPQTLSFGNTTAYRYYQIIGIDTANPGTNPNLYELEFKTDATEIIGWYWDLATTYNNLFSLSNNNWTASSTDNTKYLSMRGSSGKSSGKWYFETKVTGTDTVYAAIGLGNSSAATGTDGNTVIGENANTWGYQPGGTCRNNDSTVTTSPATPTYTANDIIQVAWDATNGKIFFGKNNTWLNGGDPAAGTGYIWTGVSGTLYPILSVGDTDIVWSLQYPTYTVPAGFSIW